MFPLEELVVPDGFCEIIVEIGASFLFVKIAQIIHKIIG